MQEFDELKPVIASAITTIQSLVAKITNLPAPVQDPTPADVSAATVSLKAAVDAANAVLDPVPAAPPSTPA